MHVLIESQPVATERRPIPFWQEIVESKRILDAATEKEWLDDAEKRLRGVLSQIDPRPTIDGYSIERSDEGLTVFTVTSSEVGKREIGLLSAGDWPYWDEIVQRVPEFDGTKVVFDAVRRLEWLRCWNMRLQHDRICADDGIFS